MILVSENWSDVVGTVGLDRVLYVMASLQCTQCKPPGARVTKLSRKPGPAVRTLWSLVLFNIYTFVAWGHRGGHRLRAPVTAVHV